MRGCLFVLLLLIQASLAAVELRIGGNSRAELAEMNVSCKLEGRFLIRRMELGFRHDHLGAAEGELVCPIAKTERIVDYAMEVRGVRRQGVVVPRKQARHAYETIVSRKVDPGILEVDEEKQEFRTRVFPLLRGEIKRVWITTLSIVEDEKVEIWPDGFGTPELWSLRMDARGGDLIASSEDWSFEEEGARWRASRRGIRSSLPGCLVRWRPGGQGYRWEEEGQVSHCWFVSPRPQERAIGKRIELWVDGTVRPQMDMLPKLLERMKEGQVVLRVFRETVGTPEIFAVKSGKAGELLERLQSLKAAGMARPQFLPWKVADDIDAVFLMTDGEFVEGESTVGHPLVPLHIIDSGRGKSAWLRLRALASGGGWHGNGEIDPQTGRYYVKRRPGHELGWKGDRLVVVSRNVEPAREGEFMDSPAAYWTWGELQATAMERGGANRQEMSAFRYTHRVQGGRSAWLVLETPRDYAEFGIEPPKSDLELRRGWAEELKRVEQWRETRMKRFAEAWHERCDHLDRDQGSAAERIEKEIEDNLAFWNRTRQQLEEVHEQDLAGLKEILATVRERPENIDEKAGRKLLQALKRADEIDGELWSRLKQFSVTVGGQVRKPGRYWLLKGATLKEAVEEAGGATEFGAIRRISLFRGGRRYTYDLTKGDHQQLPLLEGDTLDVPQTRLFERRGPSRGQPGTRVTVQLRDWRPSSVELARLDRALRNNGEEWMAVWEKVREKVGAAPTLYQETLDLLARRERWELVTRVALEFAELAPLRPQQLLLVAQYLRRSGELDMALVIGRRVCALTEKVGGARFDLALSLQEDGRVKEAARLFWKGLQETRSEDIALIYLEELNALLHRSGADGVALGIDSRFLRYSPVKLRMRLQMSGEYEDLDFKVGRQLTNLRRAENARFRGDKLGMKNELFHLQTWSWGSYLPGMFEGRVGRFTAKGGSDRGTVELEIVQDLGLPSERRRVMSMRVDKEGGSLGKVEVLPREWLKPAP